MIWIACECLVLLLSVSLFGSWAVDFRLRMSAVRSTDIPEFGSFSGITTIHATNADGHTKDSSSSNAMPALRKVSATPNGRNPSYPSKAVAHGLSPDRSTQAKHAALRLSSSWENPAGMVVLA